MNHPIRPDSGFFVIDKPEGITSHDAVQLVRRHLKAQKVGHLGTLDPMATGVLPIAVGRATRLIAYVKNSPKIYEGSIQLGFSTDTDDRQGKPASQPVVPATSQEELQELAFRMSGEQWQVPPLFSAKKIGGVRAYRLARQGVDLAIAPQRIRIDELRFVLRHSSIVDFTICCSAGTYVRSVARDLGTRLGCGAHLIRLRRLLSGDFEERQCIDLASFTALDPAELRKQMIPPSSVLGHYPVVVTNAIAEQAVPVGRDFQAQSPGENFMESQLFRVVSSEGRLLGLARRVAHETVGASEFWLHPVVVLAGKE